MVHTVPPLTSARNVGSRVGWGGADPLQAALRPYRTLRVLATDFP